LEFDDDFCELGRCLPMEWDDDLLNEFIGFVMVVLILMLFVLVGFLAPVGWFFGLRF
jgi:hypothetical protein